MLLIDTFLGCFPHMKCGWSRDHSCKMYYWEKMVTIFWMRIAHFVFRFSNLISVIEFTKLSKQGLFHEWGSLCNNLWLLNFISGRFFNFQNFADFTSNILKMRVSWIHGSIFDDLNFDSTDIWQNSKELREGWAINFCPSSGLPDHSISPWGASI